MRTPGGSPTRWYSGTDGAARGIVVRNALLAVRHIPEDVALYIEGRVQLEVGRCPPLVLPLPVPLPVDFDVNAGEVAARPADRARIPRRVVIGARHISVVVGPADLDIVDLDEDGDAVDRGRRRDQAALIHTAVLPVSDIAA